MSQATPTWFMWQHLLNFKEDDEIFIVKASGVSESVKAKGQQLPCVRATLTFLPPQRGTVGTGAGLEGSVLQEL